MRTSWRPGAGLHIIAHRGGAALGPENSLEAIAAAHDAGATDVEVDVHETGDGSFVVTHDAIIDGRSVSEMSLAEFRSVTDQPVVLVGHVLRALATSPLGLYLDVKQLLPGGVERLLQEIVEAGVADRCVFGSFRADLVAHAAQFAAVPTSLLFHDPGMDLHSVVAGVGCDLLHPCFDVFADPFAAFTDDWVERARRTGAGLIAWNVTDTDAATRLMAMGVDGICADDPAVVRSGSA
jgi:glycerophosphoryl diester phosphodiesterase